MKSKTSASLAFSKQKVSKPRSFSELKKFCFIESIAVAVVADVADVTSLPGLGVASSGGDVRVDAGMLPFEIDPGEESVGLKQIKNFRVKRNQNEANSE